MKRKEWYELELVYPDGQSEMNKVIAKVRSLGLAVYIQQCLTKFYEGTGRVVRLTV